MPCVFEDVFRGKLHQWVVAIKYPGRKNVLVDEEYLKIPIEAKAWKDLTPDEIKAMSEPMEGGFEGIGVEFLIKNDTLMVVTALPGGPSEGAGIRAGDRILKVEEEQISRSRIAEEDTFFLIIPLLLAFVAKAFCSREKPPDDFDDKTPRREQDRDDGIVAAAEKEAEMFIAFQVRRGEEKKMDKVEKNLIDQKRGKGDRGEGAGVGCV